MSSYSDLRMEHLRAMMQLNSSVMAVKESESQELP